MNEDLESSFGKFWADIPIPEGYYTGEAKMACLHAQGISCGEARSSQLEVSDDEAETVPNDPEGESVIRGLTEQGGMMLGHPAIREGHRVALIALPIPEEFTVEQHPDGYWMASMVTDSGESPPAWRLTHEVTGATKNEVVRNLIRFAEAIPTDMNQAPVVAMVVSPDMFGMEPGSMSLGSTINLN